MADGLAEPQSAPPVSKARRSNERLGVYAVLGVIAAVAISRGNISSDVLIRIAVIVPSIILHEVSHGAVANAFGDDTAKRAGRLTLNPISHIDLFGTLLMPAMLALSGAPIFGFAKPVPVNLSRLRHPRNEGLLVSLAGPATNFAIALIAALIFRFLTPVADSTLFNVVADVGVLNLFLGTFNMLPVPPLDGSALVERMLPRSLWPSYLTLRRYSMVLVLVVVFYFDGAIDAVFRPVLRVWARVAGFDI